MCGPPSASSGVRFEMAHALMNDIPVTLMTLNEDGTLTTLLKVE